MTHRYNQPDEGTTDWHLPLNKNFADLEIEVEAEVATWGDLPTASGKTSSNGQPRVFRVNQDDVFVRDTGSGWEIIGGCGSTSHPLPNVQTKSVGVGTTAPDNIASSEFPSGEVRAGISGTGHQRVVTEAFVDNKNDGVQYTGVTRRGTPSSPSAVQDSDLMTYLSTYGYDGSDVIGTGGLQFRVDGTVSTGVIPMKYRAILTDASGTAFVHSQGKPDGTLSVDNGALQSLAGGSTYGNGALLLGSNGARLEKNGLGEVVVIDDAGNETVLS